MDLPRQLKNALGSGNLIFGQRQTIGACDNGETKLVLLSANCPPEYVSELQSAHPDLPLHRVNLVNRELGAACAKPFSISVIGVVDAGNSELLLLRPNLD